MFSLIGRFSVIVKTNGRSHGLKEPWSLQDSCQNIQSYRSGCWRWAMSLGGWQVPLSVLGACLTFSQIGSWKGSQQWRGAPLTCVREMYQQIPVLVSIQIGVRLEGEGALPWLSGTAELALEPDHGRRAGELTPASLGQCWRALPGGADKGEPASWPSELPPRPRSRALSWPTPKSTSSMKGWDSCCSKASGSPWHGATTGELGGVLMRIQRWWCHRSQRSRTGPATHCHCKWRCVDRGIYYRARCDTL